MRLKGTRTRIGKNIKTIKINEQKPKSNYSIRSIRLGSLKYPQNHVFSVKIQK